jgi:hypothetical protein
MAEELIIDVKMQAFEDDRNAVDDWDQRKSSGEFRGSEEGMHVKTLLEFRAKGDFADLLINPERLSEFIKPGDNVLTVLNRIQATFSLADSLLGPAKALLPYDKIGTFAYDKD